MLCKLCSKFHQDSGENTLNDLDLVRKIDETVSASGRGCLHSVRV